MPDLHIAPPLIALTLGALILFEPSGAQSTTDADRVTSGILEEVIVTARRRDESSLDVPMSITVLDGAVLEDFQYRDLDDFLALSPGVQVYTGTDAVTSRIIIRGVVTPGELTEPGNAVYVDEVYSSGMRTVFPAFYDIQSVQVLKGPQAGLYGRNTVGGAVLITTGQPTDERFARIDASYAQYGATDVNGTINGPLSDTLQARATAWYNEVEGGYYQSGIFDKNLDASSQAGGRLTLALQPGERVALSLTGEYADMDRPGFTGFEGEVAHARLGPAPLAPESRRHILRDDQGGGERQSARLTGKLDIDTSAGNLVALAGWRKIRARAPDYDFDGTAYAASYADYLANPASALAVPSPLVMRYDDRDTSLSVELRYYTPDSGGSWQAVVGASYYEDSVRVDNVIAPTRDFALILQAIGQEGSFSRYTDQKTDSRAGFVELLWTPLATFEVTGDLRYTVDHKDLYYVQSAAGYFHNINLQTTTVDTSERFDNWSPGITLAHKPDDTLTLYAKYVRGFRSGGFNTLVFDPALLSYESEEAQNYELGLKALLLARRLELGASVFQLRIDNALLPRLDPGGAVDFYPLQNVGPAETTGLEVDLTAQLGAGLALTAAGGAYNFKRPDGNTEPPFAPDYTASLLVNYEHGLTDALTGLARLGFRHRSGGRVPGGLNAHMDSYYLLDGQLGMRRRQTECVVFVRNALDDHYVVNNYGLALGQYGYVDASGLDPLTTRTLVRDPGRVFGVRVTALF